MINTFTMVLDLILPVPSTDAPATIAKEAITFFETWISRIGGIVAFCGAIKLALSLQTEDAREQMTSVLTMVSGFMIMAAVSETQLALFSIPETYTKAAAEAEFDKIVEFIGKWTRRVGALGLLLGSVSFGFAIKDNNAVTKVTALKAIVASATVMTVSELLKSIV